MTAARVHPWYFPWPRARRAAAAFWHLAELEKAASAAHPPVTAWYRKVIDQRRKTQTRELTEKIKNRSNTPPQLDQMDSPSGARGSIVQPMTALVTELQCQDSDAAAKIQRDVAADPAQAV